MGRTIEIATPASAAEAYLTGEDVPGRPGVLLYVDAIGLRPRIAEMADRIASWGHVVLAPHVFHREGRAADLAPHADLRVPGNREAFFAEAMPRVHRLTPALSDADAPAWLAALREHASGPIGVTGYCMGARLAVRTAGLFPDEVAAVGGFHGGRLVTEDPDSPHLALARARAEFVFGHAANDAAMPPEAVSALGEALDAAGLRSVNEVYPAPHGYTMSDSSAYDEAATERHFAALEELFGRVLGAGAR
ncbi:dienelactone hydrolase family protein [Nocardioides sp. zg-DK7169]|uniref:dienelactone hydrolase family protein n=1 Tax=Nocardioides sp. zg-DK7169 TaxID=2736600 RepID=UPI00155692E2|nr:dienelactone hydrolase family protein [Nocardioides sp. zg-DK7169]NPC95879.1 dienelactone hydrolase family protein [Nocardioides sp. zg-DK7169]